MQKWIKNLKKLFYLFKVHELALQDIHLFQFLRAVKFVFCEKVQKNHLK